MDSDVDGFTAEPDFHFAGTSARTQWRRGRLVEVANPQVEAELREVEKRYVELEQRLAELAQSKASEIPPGIAKAIEKITEAALPDKSSKSFGRYQIAGTESGKDPAVYLVDSTTGEMWYFEGFAFIPLGHLPA